MITDTRKLEASLDAVGEKAEETRVLFDEWEEGVLIEEPDQDLLDDVARSAVVLLQDALSLVRELREAGAEVAEVPVEEEALMTVITNGRLIQEHVEQEVRHLETVLTTIRGGKS